MHKQKMCFFRKAVAEDALGMGSMSDDDGRVGFDGHTRCELQVIGQAGTHAQANKIHEKIDGGPDEEEMSCSG